MSTNDDGMKTTLTHWAAVIDKMPPGEARDLKRAEWQSWVDASGYHHEDDPRTDGQQLYDTINARLAPTTEIGPEGYPKSVHPGSLELWRKMPEASPYAAPFVPHDEELAEVTTWLQTAAKPVQGAELLALAKRSPLVFRPLLASARAAAYYKAGRP